jgi:hypothetical protein
MDFPRVERLLRESKHHGGIFSDGVEHDWVFEFSRHLADDVDAFSLKLLKVRKIVGFHSESWGVGANFGFFQN